MNRLQIENILGFTAHVNTLRATLSGDEYRDLIPAPEWKEEIVKRDATVEETVEEMIKLIKKYNWQTRELSKRLLGKDINTTCKNTWTFLFMHCLYCEDTKGREELRTPALSWYLRRIRGIDCLLRGSNSMNPARGQKIKRRFFNFRRLHSLQLRHTILSENSKIQKRLFPARLCSCAGNERALFRSRCGT